MDSKNLDILNEFKQSLLDELEEYVKINADSAKWRMDFWKKHQKDVEGITQFALLHQLDLSAYYAYGNAKDIVEEKFNEIIKKYENTD